MGTVVMGTDIGFASFGVAIVELGSDEEHVDLLEVIRTEKESKKRNTLAADDNIRRAREIYRRLSTLRREYDVKVVCGEAMSFPRHSGNAAKMSLAWGTVAALTEQYGLPLVQASPQRLKMAVCGNKSASKQEVEDALIARYGERIRLIFDGPGGQREHAFDALGSIVAALESDVIRMARKAA